MRVLKSAVAVVTALWLCFGAPVAASAEGVQPGNLTRFAHHLSESAASQSGQTDPAMPVPAENAAAPAAAEPTAEAPNSQKVAIGEQIVTNFHMVQILTFGAKKGLLAQPSIQVRTPEERDRLMALVDQEMQKSSGAIVRKLAEGNVDRFSIAQLNDILALSKIKYAQDLVLAGADPTLAVPDASSMTPEERNLVIRSDTSPHISDFLVNFNFETAKPEMLEALRTAFQAWLK